MFVSSINAYPGWPEEHVDEDSAVWAEELDDYGPLKVACERALPAGSAIVRAGLLCGPYDNIGRLGLVARADRARRRRRRPRAGRARAAADRRARPGGVDGRSRGALRGGPFNGTAPSGQTTMRAMLETGDRHDGLRRAPAVAWRRRARRRRRRAVDRAAAVASRGRDVDGRHRARAGAGLRCRPIADTVAATWAWLRAGADVSDYRAEMRPAGLTREREAQLLAL